MKLTEAEMRMVFQIESTNQNAALNEIYMTWRYAPNQAVRKKRRKAFWTSSVPCRIRSAWI